MESEPVQKKQRKPRAKKQIVEEIKTEVIEPEQPKELEPPKRSIIKRLNKNKQAEEEKKPEQHKKEDYKGSVILGIDPAFKKCGFGIISLDKGEYIDSFQREMRPYEKKLNQGQVDGYIGNNVQKTIDELFQKYKIEYVVIELQLGQFSADRIQLSFVQALPQNVAYTVQHSKLKLKHKQTKEIKADNPDSNKYNQNKHQGRQLAKMLFPDMPTLTFDEYDSLLHCKYAYDNLQKIEWVKKSELK